jgi:hypothetical protein
MRKEIGMVLSFFRSPPQRHVVDHGRVGCSLRGRDVELDTCMACVWLDGVDERARIPVVVCRPGHPLANVEGF